MSSSAPLTPQTPGNTPASETPQAPNFELTLRKFWEKNARFIYLACATVFVVILVKGGLEWRRSENEKKIAAAYAAASTSDKLRAFAAENSDHVLGAAAQLRLADEAYADGKYADALAGYQKAAAVFEAGPFAGRALLGAAISKIHAGQAADGEAKLKQLADDANQPKVIRAEAAYHLGTLAVDANRSEDAAKFFDQVTALDPVGNWARRSFLHRTSLSPATPSVSLAPTSIAP